jgi:hypothetical protein
MNHFLSLLFITTFFVSVSAHASNKCADNKREIGTTIKVTLALDHGQSVDKQFSVMSCKNGIFTAKDKTENSTVLQYDAGQGEDRQVRFVGVSKTSGEFRPVVSGMWNIKTQKVSFNAPAPGQCPSAEHWDAGMKMCMPDQCAAGQHWDASMKMCMPDQNQQCPSGQIWDPAMKMCMPGQANGGQCPANQQWDPAMKMCMPGNSSGLMTMFHYNQFIVLTGASGPRGRTAVTAPNMWMLMVDKKISDLNTVELSWMGTTDLWTVPKNGTPELFQAGEANASGKPYIDAQHPHSSPIMGLTFSDIMSFGANGEKKLTFFFAPRGEATAGPESFMHRASAEGNPDAPLGHHLQDVFHISSTVIGVKADYGKWTVEASTFSGVEPSPAQVDLDIHNPDSYAFRTNYRANSNVTIGASYARVNALDRANNPLKEVEDERASAAWVQTSNMFKGGTLNTTTLWGRNDNKTTDVQLNSFLEEFLYELGKNNFYGRLEILQRTPDQLEVQVTDGKTGTKWIQALTFGYERQIQDRGNMKMLVGAAVTTYSVPKEFRVTYGDNPVAAKMYLRIKFNSGMPMGH